LADFGSVDSSVLIPPNNGEIFADQITVGFNGRTDFISPPILIPVLKIFDLGNTTASLETTFIQGVDQNWDSTLDNFVTIYLKNSYPSRINSLNYILFIFCDKGLDCFKYDTSIGLQGENFELDLTGLPLSKSLNTLREEEYNIAFSEFFKTKPKYFAMGISGIETSDFLLKFSLTYLDHSSNSFKFKLSMAANEFISQLQVSYIASDWSNSIFYFLRITRWIANILSRFFCELF